MVEHRLEADDDDVRVDDALVEAQHIERRQHQHPREYQLQHVLARASEPVHGLGAVMHGVEFPQEGHLVIRAVGPVLRQVGRENAQQQLQHEGNATHECVHAVAHQPAEQAEDQEVDRQQDQANDEVVDREVHQVGLPFAAEHSLPAIEREHLFDHHEDQRRAEQVEDEPVQADVRRVIGEVAHGYARAAQRHRQCYQCECRGVQAALAAQHQVAQRHAAGHQ